MNSFEKNRTSSRMGRSGTLGLALAVLMLSGVGFAAAGGVDAVKGLWVKIWVNGAPVDPADFEGDIDVERSGEWMTVTVTADSAELGPDGSATVTVSADAEGAAEADDE